MNIFSKSFFAKFATIAAPKLITPKLVKTVKIAKKTTKQHSVAVEVASPAKPIKVLVEPKPFIPLIYPYKINSNAGKLLGDTLKAKRIYANGNYSYNAAHLIINYGNCHTPNWSIGFDNIKILNHWSKIILSSNKLKAFKILDNAGVRVPKFCTVKEEAVEWAKKGYRVICRTILKGHSGHGIIVALEAKDIVDAPLYSLYKPNSGEYRVIVVNGVVVDFMQKKRKIDFEEITGQKVNSLIRNHSNGWIFARNEVNPPKDVFDESIKAVNALNLDFAGVDVIFNKKEGKAYILECNSAMGLEADGTTLKRLSAAFLDICNHKIPASII
jgi:hypothetical protein